MESGNDVELGEELGIGQMIEGLLQLGNKVSVFDGDIIKFLVIHTYLNTSPRFVNKDHWGAGGECAGVYEFFLKVLIQPLLEHFELISDHGIQRVML